jgi:hypothetical protein
MEQGCKSESTHEPLVAQRECAGEVTEERASEELVDHVGFGHLEALSGASASLGLISTLVLSLCISTIVDKKFEEMRLTVMFLCLSTTCSTYTTCYSLLEYYYIQMFVGVERYLGARIDGDTDESLRKRAGLVSEVRSIFASYNVMRAAARNCMWMGLVCLVISAMIHVNPFEELAPTMSSSTRTCIFFSIWATLCGSAWLILLVVVFIVPYTMSRFRMPLLDLVKKFSNV